MSKSAGSQINAIIKERKRQEQKILEYINKKEAQYLKREMVEIYKMQLFMASHRYSTMSSSEYTKSQKAGSLYHQENLLLDSVYAAEEDGMVSIYIDELNYPNVDFSKSDLKDTRKQSSPRTTTQVHEWLTKGSRGGGVYPYNDKKGEIRFAYNRPIVVPEGQSFEDLAMEDIQRILIQQDLPRKRKEWRKEAENKYYR